MNSPTPDVIKKNYPFESKFFTLKDGYRMHYVDEGAGEVLVFAHGNPTWSFLYRKFIQHYAQRGFRAVAMDHIGFGLSDKPTDKNYYTLARHIGNYSQLIEHLGLRDVSLIMQDWGGPISMGYATQNPSAIKRLIILNTWAFVQSYAVPVPLWFSLLMKPGIGEFVYGTLNLFVNFMLPYLGTVQRVPKDIMASYRFPFLNPANRRGIVQFPRMIPANMDHPEAPTMARIEENLKELTNKPAVLIWAKKDLAFSLEIAAHWKTLLPNIQGPRVIEKAGHFLQEDAPEQIIRYMDQFLEQPHCQQ